MASTVSVRSDRFECAGCQHVGPLADVHDEAVPFTLRTAATSDSMGDTCLIWPAGLLLRCVGQRSGIIRFQSRREVRTS